MYTLKKIDCKKIFSDIMRLFDQISKLKTDNISPLF